MKFPLRCIVFLPSCRKCNTFLSKSKGIRAKNCAILKPDPNTTDWKRNEHDKRHHQTPALPRKRTGYSGNGRSPDAADAGRLHLPGAGMGFRPRHRAGKHLQGHAGGYLCRRAQPACPSCPLRHQRAVDLPDLRKPGQRQRILALRQSRSPDAGGRLLPRPRPCRQAGGAAALRGRGTPHGNLCLSGCGHLRSPRRQPDLSGIPRRHRVGGAGCFGLVYR